MLTGEIRKQIDSIWDDFWSGGVSSSRIIHYSRESFDDRPDGRSPRITSIAIRRLDSSDTASFSIHRVAEAEGVALNEIEIYYDRLEREMLELFYHYIATAGEVTLTAISRAPGS